MTTARDELYARLVDVLGDPEARTLMRLLPDEAERIATASDVALVRGEVEDLGRRVGRLEERMDRFEDRMGKFEASQQRFDDRLHGFHDVLRDQTNKFIIVSSTSALLVGGLAFAAASLT